MRATVTVAVTSGDIDQVPASVILCPAVHVGEEQGGGRRELKLEVEAMHSIHLPRVLVASSSDRSSCSEAVFNLGVLIVGVLGRALHAHVGSAHGGVKDHGRVEVALRRQI